VTDPTFRPDHESAARREEAQPEDRAMKAAAPPAGAAAGAIAGATAGLATGVFGPIGAAVGAIVGALGGTAAGTAAAVQPGSDTLYTVEDDDRYRRLWESHSDRPDDRGFDSVRAAYQFGHLAARHPDFRGSHFGDVESRLRERWPNELRQQAGDWDSVRPYVEDAYGAARSRGVGERRDANIIGTGGSAVDPVELDRARAGLPSVPEGDRPG
jgi:hypothetical protein